MTTKVFLEKKENELYTFFTNLFKAMTLSRFFLKKDFFVLNKNITNHILYNVIGKDAGQFFKVISSDYTNAIKQVKLDNRFIKSKLLSELQDFDLYDIVQKDKQLQSRVESSAYLNTNAYALEYQKDLLIMLEDAESFSETLDSDDKKVVDSHQDDFNFTWTLASVFGVNYIKNELAKRRQFDTFKDTLSLMPVKFRKEFSILNNEIKIPFNKHSNLIKKYGLNSLFAEDYFKKNLKDKVYPSTYIQKLFGELNWNLVKKSPFILFFNPDPVTDVCTYLNGTVVENEAKSIAIAPPLHHRCKSTLIALDKAEVAVQAIDELKFTKKMVKESNFKNWVLKEDS